MHTVGTSAVLVDCDGLDDVEYVCSWFRARGEGIVGEIVPASRTVLLVATAGAEQAMRELAAKVPEEFPRTMDLLAGDEIVIPVRYDGEDLALVAALLGIGGRELVHRHTRTPWRVGFIGFVPGFGYLHSEDWPFVLARRSTPRTRVPAGSVAIADAYSGIYPRVAPGGWHLLGTTDVPLWDSDRTPPALLQPGARVRFEEAG